MVFRKKIVHYMGFNVNMNNQINFTSFLRYLIMCFYIPFSKVGSTNVFLYLGMDASNFIRYMEFRTMKFGV